MANLTKDIPVVNWTPEIGNAIRVSNSKECGNCKHEISDIERIQHIKQQIRDRVPVEKQDDKYCRLKKCKFQKKRDK